MVVNSLVTSLRSGQQVPRARRSPSARRLGRGSGIDAVEVSSDFGGSWQRARLGKDLAGTRSASSPSTCRARARRAGRQWRAPREVGRDAGEPADLQSRRLSPQLSSSALRGGGMRLAVALISLAAASCAWRRVQGRAQGRTGKDKVMQCVACPRLDYIQMNSRFLDKAG